jgi:predicted HicB family RNase H-like nuclease
LNATKKVIISTYGGKIMEKQSTEKVKIFSVKLPTDLHKRLKMSACKSEVTIQEWIIRGIEDLLIVEEKIQE